MYDIYIYIYSLIYTCTCIYIFFNTHGYIIHLFISINNDFFNKKQAAAMAHQHVNICNSRSFSSLSAVVEGAFPFFFYHSLSFFFNPNPQTLNPENLFYCFCLCFLFLCAFFLLCFFFKLVFGVVHTCNSCNSCCNSCNSCNSCSTTLGYIYRYTDIYIYSALAPCTCV